jgi:hypothetical protein
MSLITKDDVIAYSSIASVIARGDKLSNDVLRAELMVYDICGHDFTATDPITGLPVYPTIPDSVKLAATLWAEHYALQEISKETAGFKSETLENYSYTKAGNASVTEPDTYLLLKPYITGVDASNTNVVLRMRAL